jgi:hypothetical protein
MRTYLETLKTNFQPSRHLKSFRNSGSGRKTLLRSNSTHSTSLNSSNCTTSNIALRPRSQSIRCPQSEKEKTGLKFKQYKQFKVKQNTFRSKSIRPYNALCLTLPIVHVCRKPFVRVKCTDITEK